MAAVSIRDLDDGVREKLRVRAAENGRSMEAEIRTILTDAVSETPNDFVSALLERFGNAHGVDFDLPSRDFMPRAATFSE